MSRIRNRTAAATAAVGILAAPMGVAQAGQDHQQGTWQPPVDHRQQVPAPVDAAAFVAKATKGNAFEIASSELAAERSESPEIRAIAEQIAADHTAAQEKLTAAAEEAGVPVPETGLSERQQAVVGDLESLSGDEFGAAYVEAQIAAHKKAIALCLGFAADDSNPEPLVAYAKDTVTVLKQHLHAVKALTDDGQQELPAPGS
jgi:putative membrane protein